MRSSTSGSCGASNFNDMQPDRSAKDEQQPTGSTLGTSEPGPEAVNSAQAVVSREEIQTPVEAAIDAEAERTLRGEQRSADVRKPIVSIHGRDVCETDLDGDRDKVA